MAKKQSILPIKKTVTPRARKDVILEHIFFTAQNSVPLYVNRRESARNSSAILETEGAVWQTASPSS